MDGAKLSEYSIKRGPSLKTGRSSDHVETTPIQRGSNGRCVDVVRISGGRLQSQTHEVGVIVADPFDLVNRIMGRVIHHADLHFSASVLLQADDSARFPVARLGLPIVAKVGILSMIDAISGSLILPSWGSLR
jgi:hypothetical protein